jgi:hypothetical protein
VWHTFVCYPAIKRAFKLSALFLSLLSFIPYLPDQGPENPR